MFVQKLVFVINNRKAESCLTLVGSGLTCNILSWKGLPGTNTLAYNKYLQIMDEKGCIILDQSVIVLKLFFSICDVPDNVSYRVCFIQFGRGLICAIGSSKSLPEWSYFILPLHK